MKWIGRILYIMLVLIIIGFIEIIAGGAQGIRVSEYIYNNVTKHAMENENYDIFDGLDHLNAVSKTYYSRNQIRTLDDQAYYDTTGELINEEHQVKIGMYPHVVVHKNPQFNLYSDGFFVVIEDYSPDVAYYTLEVTAYYAQDSEKKPIVLKDESYLNVYTDIRESNANRGSFRVALIANNSFANYLIQEGGNDFEFPEDYNFEYHIQAIDVYATFIDPDTPDTPEKVHIYRLTDGATFPAGEPKVTHTNLNLAPDTYNLSKNMGGVEPTVDQNDYNLVLAHHPADLSPYNSAYWIVYGVYGLFFVVIPYFWFVHKHVMRKFRKNKDDDDDSTDSTRIPQPQLFSDIEPKSDK